MYKQEIQREIISFRHFSLQWGICSFLFINISPKILRRVPAFFQDILFIYFTEYLLDYLFVMIVFGSSSLVKNKKTALILNSDLKKLTRKILLCICTLVEVKNRIKCFKINWKKWFSWLSFYDHLCWIILSLVKNKQFSHFILKPKFYIF